MLWLNNFSWVGVWQIWQLVLKVGTLVASSKPGLVQPL